MAIVRSNKSIPGFNGVNTGVPANENGGINNGLRQTQSHFAMAFNFINGGSGNSSGSAGGRVDWTVLDKTNFKDNTLDRIKKSSGYEDDFSKQRMMERTGEAMIVFLRNLVNEGGFFYQVYKACCVSFPMDQDVGIQSEPLSKFIEICNGNKQIYLSVVRSMTTVFSYNLICRIKEKGGALEDPDLFQQEDYVELSTIAINNVFFLEFVNWLVNSSEGNRYIHRIPARMKKKMANIDEYIENMNGVFGYMGVDSPYKGMNTKIENPSNDGIIDRYMSAVVSPSEAFNWDREIEEHQKVHVSNDKEELLQYLEEETSRYSKKPLTINHQPTTSGLDWSSDYRKDFENITKENISEFNIFSQMTRVPDETHDFVADPKIWQYIDRALNPSSTVGFFNNTIAYIYMDSEDIDGSYECSAKRIPKGETVMAVLTDPRKILPEIVETEDGLRVVEVKEEEIIEKRVDKIVEPNKGDNFFLTITKQEVEEIDPIKLYHTVEEVAQAAAREYKDKPFVIGTKVFAREMLNIGEGNPEKLKEGFDLLFRHSEFGKERSFSDLMKRLEYFKDAEVVDEARNFNSFIIKLLTNEFNEILLTHYGYDNLKQAGEHSQFVIMDDLVHDYKSLITYAQDKNGDLYEDLMSNSATHLKTPFNMLRLGKDFATDEKSLKNTTLEESVVIEREYIYYAIHSGLFPQGDKEFFEAKRSQIPDLFKLMDSKHSVGKRVLVSFGDVKKVYQLERNAYSTDTLTLLQFKPGRTLTQSLSF